MKVGIIYRSDTGQLVKALFDGKGEFTPEQLQQLPGSTVDYTDNSEPGVVHYGIILIANVFPSEAIANDWFRRPIDE